MKSPAPILQEAQYQRLKTDLSIPVYDSVPNEAPYPFIAIGEAITRNRSPKGESVLNISTTTHVYSRYAGMKETKEVVNLVVISLSKPKSLDLGPSFRIILDRFDEIMDLREDEVTRHSVIRWNYLIEEV